MAEVWEFESREVGNEKAIKLARTIFSNLPNEIWGLASNRRDTTCST